MASRLCSHSPTSAFIGAVMLSAIHPFGPPFTSVKLPPLLDTILAHAGNQLFIIHANHRDFERHAKLWVLVHRFEEFHYSAELRDLTPFLASLGPAPNLKVLRL